MQQVVLAISYPNTSSMVCDLMPPCDPFFLFFGGRDVHYTSATIATSRVCEVHSKAERQQLTTQLEFVKAIFLNNMAMKGRQATVLLLLTWPSL